MNEAKESSICLDRPPSATSTSTSSSFRTSTDARSLSLSLPHQTTPRQPNPTHDRDFLKAAAADLKKKKPGLPAPGPRGRGHPGGCARPIRRWQGGRGEARRARRRWRRGGPVEARRKGGEDAPDGGERGGLAWRRREIGSFLLFLHLFSVTRHVSFFIPSLFFFKCLQFPSGAAAPRRESSSSSI